MNKKLEMLLEWANTNNLDTDSWEIHVKLCQVNLWQFEQTRENFRAIKTAVGGFTEKGSPPSVNLEAKVQILENEWIFVWYSAYSCEETKTYECTPAKFLDSEEESGSHP